VTTKPSILITGAAAGIGRAFAHTADADGVALVLVDRNDDALQEVASKLRCAGHDVHALALDLCLPESRVAIEAALAEHGLHCEILVNNAGVSLAMPALACDRERQLAVIDLHVVALTDLTLRFLPGMIERRSGGILNVSSIAAYIPGPNMAVYHATKRYIRSFSLSLAREVANSGVKVCCLVPGRARTAMWSDDVGSDRGLIYRLPMISAEATAAAGWEGLRRGKKLIIPQLFFRLVTLALRFAPTRAYLMMSKGWFGPITLPGPPAGRRPATIITGATSPAGKRLARQAAVVDRDLVLVGRRRESLDALAHSLAASGARVHIAVLDLARPEAGVTLEGRLAELGLYGEVLMQAARPSLSGSAATLDRQAQLDLLAIRLRTPTDLTLRLLPAMALGGSIHLFVSSPRQPGAVAEAADAYASWLGKALACEKIGTGATVHVTAISA
jgi:short-subunit dehydrogenase